MNFIFISPQFPRTYWNFCDRLKRNGVNVLGIGDSPYDSLDGSLKAALTEYYKVDNLEDYSQVFRAVAFFSFKYGKIDWLESNNEYWLEQDARLRTDFHITTGADSKQVQKYKSKYTMKTYYAKAGVPSARSHRIKDLRGTEKFLEEVGYPVIVKPEIGVGASDTWKLEKREDFDRFLAKKLPVPYVMEEFVTGDIVSYDAITDSQCNPIFESMTEWPPSIADIVNEQRELTYYVAGSVDPKLAEMGRATVKAFGVASRFVHLEFFRLTKAKKGLGKKGDYVGLEVNMRPAGGYTPDMMDFAHSVDVYTIWADMCVYDKASHPIDYQNNFCFYVSRRDGKTYKHTHEEVVSMLGSRLVMCERIPDGLSGAMGNQMYTAKASSYEEIKQCFDFVLEKA